jgi:hypothetical protein
MQKAIPEFLRMQNRAKCTGLQKRQDAPESLNDAKAPPDSATLLCRFFTRKRAA